ncbi:autoinducer 2 ABC transporter substrate-binding protein [Streptomyces sp. NPDC059224]|uniref:autoinducer 2 ABC transporter substrate-binding protein n=1 Tax=Streptomyces sp. NPDC059224 TaxID=3346775 RepID=UPI00369459AE
MTKTSRWTAAGVAAAVVLTAAACSSTPPGGGSSAGRGGPVEVAFVPKLVGIPYFTAMQKGGEKAASDLGVKFIYQGPATADSAAQIQVIDSLITRHVDAIAVAPDDPAAISPVLKRAKAAGIKVFTSDTDAPNSERALFVQQATDKAIGDALVESLAAQMGGKGKWAIVSCGPTAQSLNSWIKEQKAYSAKKYPGMQLVSVKYAGEDQDKAASITKDLMTANPDLKGVVGECTTSAPGVAQAITDAGKTGKVFSTGVATPTVMQKYVTSGAMAKVVLWNPTDLGYLTVWAGKQLAEGKSPKTNGVGDIKGISYQEDLKTLLLGQPLVFDKNNIAQYAGKF